jgi:hypothetical protein
MEALGAAASIFAVLSLAIQLGQGAADTARFLDAISDAPAEVHRLRDSLTELHAIADGVRLILDKRSTTHGPHAPAAAALPSAQLVVDRLESCKRRLDPITAVINRVTAADGKGPARRAWEKLRFVLRREQVAEMESRLARAVLMLNTALTVNLTYVVWRSSSTHRS